MKKDLAKEIYEDGYVEGYKASIEEFLKDWKWGRVYELHFSWLNFYDPCRCKPTIIQYWKWFEDKWEQRLKKE